ILLLAKEPVRNKLAYFSVALPPFLENLSDQLEQWLTERVIAYMQDDWIYADPDSAMATLELKTFMRWLLNERGLTLDPSDKTFLDRVLSAVEEHFKWSLEAVRWKEPEYSHRLYGFVLKPEFKERCHAYMRSQGKQTQVTPLRVFI